MVGFILYEITEFHLSNFAKKVDKSTTKRIKGFLVFLFHAPIHIFQYKSTEVHSLPKPKSVKENFDTKHYLLSHKHYIYPFILRLFLFWLLL